MRAKLFQVSWHAKEGGKNEPILSLDVHPTLPLLATAGADEQLRFWAIRESEGGGAGGEGGSLDVAFRFTMSGHNRWVNAVRFSPNGEWCGSAQRGGRGGGYGGSRHPSLRHTHTRRAVRRVGRRWSVRGWRAPRQG
jgi:WD40 repeat protein